MVILVIIIGPCSTVRAHLSQRVRAMVRVVIMIIFGKPNRALHGYQLNKADLQCLDFNRLFTKLSITGGISGVQYCQSYFETEIPSCYWPAYA